MTGYRYQNLTSALRDKGSPLRQYLEQRFGHSLPVRKAYAAQAGPLVVESAGADAATIGAAFDYGVRFVFDPAYESQPMFAGFGADTRLLAEVFGVIQAAQYAAANGDRELLDRACWALALTTAVYRNGTVERSSPLRSLLQRDTFTRDSLLDLAPRAALTELADLARVADRDFFPAFHDASPVVLGPTFAGSRRCAADADLIAGGCLIELKTRLGEKDPRTGARRDVLPKGDLQQLLGYVLFDTTNEYRLNRLAVYSARYGHLAEWGLSDLLMELAGEPVNLASERRHIWDLLGE